jgi:hypothetical protein
MRLFALPGSNFVRVAYLDERRLVTVDWHEPRYVTRLWDLENPAPLATFDYEQEEVIKPLLVQGGRHFLRVQGLWPEGEPIPPRLERSFLRDRGLAPDFLAGFTLPAAYGPDGASAIDCTVSVEQGVYLTSFHFRDIDGSCVALHQAERGSGGRSAVFLHGELAAMCSGNNQVAVWNWKAATEITRLDHGDKVVALAFSPHGFLAVAAGRTVSVLETVGWKCVRKFRSFRKYAHGLAVSPDGRRLLAGSDDGTARLWELATGQELANHDWNVGKLRGVSFSPDGHTAAAAGERGLVVWDVE